MAMSAPAAARGASRARQRPALPGNRDRRWLIAPPPYSCDRVWIGRANPGSRPAIFALSVVACLPQHALGILRRRVERCINRSLAGERRRDLPAREVADRLHLRDRRQG